MGKGAARLAPEARSHRSEEPAPAQERAQPGQARLLASPDHRGLVPSHGRLAVLRPSAVPSPARPAHLEHTPSAAAQRAHAPLELAGRLLVH